MMIYSIDELNDVYHAYIGICRENTQQDHQSFEAIQKIALLVNLIETSLKQQNVEFHFDMTSETYREGGA